MEEISFELKRIADSMEELCEEIKRVADKLEEIEAKLN